MNFCPENIREVNLGPGDLYFGDSSTRIRTVLGSCVAITLWHPELCIGGMCHYMLPRRLSSETPSVGGRYGDEAMKIMLDHIVRSHTKPADYQMKIFGGGRMFTGIGVSRSDIGQRNIDAAVKMAQEYRFQLVAKQVGRAHMSLLFELWTGHVWCKSSALAGPQ